MNLINSVVFSAIEASNLLSFLAIILCVGAMIMFLVKAAIVLRVQDGGEAIRTPITSHNDSQQVPRLKMTRVHIPFTFRLMETKNNSYDEINFTVSSQVKYSIQAFWGVSIRELHMSLWRPWSELSEAANGINTAIVDKKLCKQISIDLRNQLPTNERIITLKSPTPKLVLGSPPRLEYPLVIFLLKDSDPNENTFPDETVVLVNVVHLRDPVCPLPTSVLAQYLKQASGQLSCLKQLYLATGDTMSIDDNPTTTLSTTTSPTTTTTLTTNSLSLAEPVACTSSNSSHTLLCSNGPVQTEQLCVVCHYFPLSRALLPCRHTCICAICFSKLDRCPMCRAPITSYFCIRTEEYLPPNFLETRITKTNKGAVHWLDALNDKLTDFLGFR